MQVFIKMAQSGDETAWNFLYRHHNPWLYGTALRICGNSPAAKDAVQDAFIHAYLKLQQLKDPAAFAGWLKTILIRNCLHNTGDNFFYTGRDSTLFEQTGIWEDEITRKLDHYEQQIKLYYALSGLSETLQSVLLLRYFSRWQSYEQIASILCIPVGTVRSRLNQAKQKIREHWLQSDGDNDRAFKESEQWNCLYNNYFSSVHSSLSGREKLMRHLAKDLHLVYTSGKTAFGRSIIEKEIEEDLVYGNSFSSVQVMSSGILSIVEVGNTNSSEYPAHCPDSSILVLYRNKNKVTRMNLHNSH